MIISCNNCNKKFELDSDLVPTKGRLLECSACNYQWFFKKEITGKIDKPTLDNIFVNTKDTLVPRKENENLKIIYRQLTQSIQLWNAKKDL